MQMLKAILLTVAVGACAAAAGAAEPADWVDPFVGTTATGHTFPGACVPFGLVQASPDSGNCNWEYCSGYRHDDKSVYGFSQTHLNGTGCSDLGDLLLLPYAGAGDVVGTELGPKAAIDKASEKATPGYYAVSYGKGGVRVEVAAAEHSAIYRVTYGGSETGRLLADLQWGLCGRLSKLKGECAQDPVTRSGFSGTSRNLGWVDRGYSYVVEFSRPCESWKTLPARAETERAPRYEFEFDTKSEKTLLVKVALSRNGTDAAKRNLAAEIPGWDFDGVRAKARKAWNDVLGVAAIEGSDEQKKNWYTSLYHLSIQPNNIADAGEKPLYSTFSCWDTFRAAGPLYTILSPRLASDFTDSMLWQGRKTGYLPIWTLWGEDNQCMIGTHSIPMIVDAYLKGIWKGDAEAAYAQIKDTLAKPHPGRRKENWDLYDKYGYYPFDEIKGESVSRTLECAYDDWCAARMAERLGRKDDAGFFMKRSAYWKNVFDPSLGLVRGKDSKGAWREPFDPYSLGHGAEVANDFTEGNAFQYTWHVMQDPAGLVAAMGGRESFLEKLDALFSAPEKTEGMGCVVDVTGLIGQYVHGNEPSHHVIYFYSLEGRLDRTAEKVREVFDKFYLPKPDGLCGNDDCGQMSAWYVFSAMGFYPFNPCGGEYVIGAPQVPKATLKLENGKTFTVTAKNLSLANKYVKSVSLNGAPLPASDLKIRHADIMRGGELVFEMYDGAK